MTAFAERHYPDRLDPEELDSYLARGWYRMGQTIFTTHFLCFDQRIYSAVWIRVDLEAFKFSKSQRKLLTRNGKRYVHEFGPCRLDAEKETLYQRYRADFNGYLSASLRENLLDGDQETVFNTFSTTIRSREDGKLAAASFFDLGRSAAASISGIFDPDLKAHSLGYYTMLLEIQYCLDHGIRYYYPGYVVPDYERFDYKLRLGDSEYYDVFHKTWLKTSELNWEYTPIKTIRTKLLRVSERLRQVGILHQTLIYPLFEAPLLGFWTAEYLDTPVLIRLGADREKRKVYYLVVYDPRARLFKLLQCSSFDDLQFYFAATYLNSFNSGEFFMDLVVVRNTIIQAERADDFVSKLLRQTRKPETQ